MLTKNLGRSSSIALILILGSIFGASGASAAPKASPSSPPVAPISALSMNDSEGGGGSPYVPPLTTGEVLSNIGAVIRNAGGGGIVIRVLDVIVRTVRVCPTCFIP